MLLVVKDFPTLAKLVFFNVTLQISDGATVWAKECRVFFFNKGANALIVPDVGAGGDE